MTRYLYKPYGVIKAVFGLSPSQYANLVVSMAQVDGAEYCCLTQPVEQVSNVQYREYIEPSLMVQATIINTHA